MHAAGASTPTQQDHEFWFKASRYLLVCEVLVQTSLFVVLMILHLNPVVIIAICAVVLIACRIAARICKSRLKHLDASEPQPLPTN